MNENDLEAGSIEILIKFIKNPMNVANFGTNQFKIATFTSNVIVDINVMFGSIGFADKYIEHNLVDGSINNDGSDLGKQKKIFKIKIGGYITNYKLSF